MIFALLLLPLAVRGQSYTATYTYDPNNPNSLPETTETGQLGYNQCGTGSNQTSLCQNVFINGIDDFCLWGPPLNNGQTIGETEEEEVAYCLKSGYGTRLFPDGSILGAHWIQTPDYVQVTGWGNFTLIGIPGSDEGGELDPHGATGNGNPIGGLVFGNSYNGTYIQYHEWTNFMSANEFCIRACVPSPNAPALCQHIYDTMGCEWNMPGNYDSGYFESCLGDTGLPMGVYGTSTWFQGVSPTPSAHPIPASSSCTRVASLTSYSPYPTTGVTTIISQIPISTGSVVSTVPYAVSELLAAASPSGSSSVSASVSQASTASTASATKTASKGALSFGSPIPGLAGVVAFLMGAALLL